MAPLALQLTRRAPELAIDPESTIVRRIECECRMVRGAMAPEWRRECTSVIHPVRKSQPAETSLRVPDGDARVRTHTLKFFYIRRVRHSLTLCIHTDEVSSRGDEDSVKFGDYGVIRSYET